MIALISGLLLFNTNGGFGVSVPVVIIAGAPLGLLRILVQRAVRADASR